MSPVIYREPIKEEHTCRLPVTTKRVDIDMIKNIPTEPIGTIWECDVCEKRYLSRRETVFYHPRWRPIRWWHFSSNKKVRESLEADNLA